MPDSFTFESRVEWVDAGWPHVIPVPEDIAEELKSAGVRRIIVTIGGQEFRRALARSELAGPHFMMGQNALKEINIREGSPVTVTLRPDPNPDQVDVPVELQMALEQDPEAAERWETFTPGRQRSLSIYVTQAKQETTRIRRATELTEKMRTHTLHGDRK